MSAWSPSRFIPAGKGSQTVQVRPKLQRTKSTKRSEQRPPRVGARPTDRASEGGPAYSAGRIDNQRARTHTYSPTQTLTHTQRNAPAWGFATGTTFKMGGPTRQAPERPGLPTLPLPGVGRSGLLEREGDACRQRVGVASLGRRLRATVLLALPLHPPPRASAARRAAGRRPHHHHHPPRPRHATPTTTATPSPCRQAAAPPPGNCSIPRLPFRACSRRGRLEATPAPAPAPTAKTVLHRFTLPPCGRIRPGSSPRGRQGCSRH